MNPYMLIFHNQGSAHLASLPQKPPSSDVTQALPEQIQKQQTAKKCCHRCGQNQTTVNHETHQADATLWNQAALLPRQMPDINPLHISNKKVTEK